MQLNPIWLNWRPSHHGKCSLADATALPGLIVAADSYGSSPRLASKTFETMVGRPQLKILFLKNVFQTKLWKNVFLLLLRVLLRKQRNETNVFLFCHDHHFFAEPLPANFYSQHSSICLHLHFSTIQMIGGVVTTKVTSVKHGFTSVDNFLQV